MLTALYLLAVVGVTGAVTGQWLPRARGWFPGGDEDEPEPDATTRPAPSWARP